MLQTCPRNLFDRKGVFTLEAIEMDAEELELELIDGGAEDVEQEGDVYIITTSFEDFGNMQKKLEEMNIEPKSAEVQRVPNTTTALDVNGAQSALKMVDALEDDDDVQSVFHNLEMTDDLAVAAFGNSDFRSAMAPVTRGKGRVFRISNELRAESLTSIPRRAACSGFLAKSCSPCLYPPSIRT